MSNSIFEINFNDMPEYGELVNSLYMISFILIIIHILLSSSLKETKSNFNFGITGDIFNSNFINLLSIILISVLSYYLIGKKIVYINYKDNN
jgi:hypothetical protein